MWWWWGSLSGLVGVEVTGLAGAGSLLPCCCCCGGGPTGVWRWRLELNVGVERRGEAPRPSRVLKRSSGHRPLVGLKTAGEPAPPAMPPLALTETAAAAVGEPWERPPGWDAGGTGSL